MSHLEKLYEFFETCKPVNNNLREKLVSSLEFPIKFDETFKVTSVPFFTADFNLLSCELHNFIFNVLYWVVLFWYYIKTKQSHNTLTVPFEKSKYVSFATLIMKNIASFVF